VIAIRLLLLVVVAAAGLLVAFTFKDLVRYIKMRNM